MKFRYFAGLVFAGVCFAADVTVVDQIVAKVNGDIVSEDEIQRLSRELAQQLKAQSAGGGGGQSQDAYDKQARDILRDRIDELLLTQKGKELNINVDSDVSKYIANIQRQAGVTDTDKFHEFIKAQTGMTYEDYLSETRNQFLTREVVGQEVGRRISIPPKEVEDYYNQHKNDFVKEEKVLLSEILISTEGKDAAGIAAAEKKAKQVASDAQHGQRFSDLVRDNSDGATAKANGQLGAYKKGDLMKTLEDAVWSLPKGGVTAPVRIPTGFEILKVDDHSKAGLESLADAKPEIENILYAPKMQPKVREYLTQLRKSAFLQLKPGYVDTGAAPGQNTAWQDPVQLKPETVTKAEVEHTTRHKKLLGIPLPGTQTAAEGKSSSR